jgi:hypothetical protein
VEWGCCAIVPVRQLYRLWQRWRWTAQELFFTSYPLSAVARQSICPFSSVTTSIPLSSSSLATVSCASLYRIAVSNCLCPLSRRWPCLLRVAARLQPPIRAIMPCSVKQWRSTEFVVRIGDPIIPPLIVHD